MTAAAATMGAGPGTRRLTLALPSRGTVLRLAALAMTAVFLVLFLLQGSLEDARAAAGRLSFGALAVGLAAVLANAGLSALRWRYLLQAVGVRISLRRSFAAYAAATAANNVLPARGGDLLRIRAAKEAAEVPAFAVVGTLLAERMLDGFVLALWIVLGALATGAGSPMLPIGLALVAGSGLGLLLAALAATSPMRAEAFLARATRALPGRAGAAVASAGAGFVAGLGVFRSRRLFAVALGFSFALWLADVALYFALARGFGLDLSLGGAFLLEGIGNLALAVPATAAGIGSFDYLTLLGARSVGLTGGAAAAYVVAVHAFVVLPITIVGALMVRRAVPSAFRFRRREPVPATA
jgi:glycosyltransferase 2 family protein